MMRTYHLMDDISLAIRVLERLPLLLIMGAALIIGCAMRELR